MRRKLAPLAMAAVLLLAGCTGALNGPGAGDGEQGATVNFYMSDQPNAIDDFEHLNVTVTKVGFHKANASSNETEAGNESENESGEWKTVDIEDQVVDLTRLKGTNATLLSQINLSEGKYTKVFIHVSEVNGTLKDGSHPEVKLPSQKLHLNENFQVTAGESVDFVYDVGVHETGSGKYIIKPNAGESGTDQQINPVGKRGEKPEKGGEGKKGGKNRSGQQGSLAFYVSDEKNAIDDFRHLNVTISKVGFQRGGESGNWTEYDVEGKTVDLTRLKGDNATLLERFNLSEGTYTKVFIYVSEVNGTLKDGSHPEVKLPSQKLHLNKNFNVSANETTEFVYDVTVVKRGKSGAYNIKPVVSESGTDVPIDKVDEKEKQKNETEAPALNASFVGNVTRGENVTVAVSANGSAVANATVEVAQLDATFTTDANGTVTFRVPENVSELEVTVTKGDREVELKHEFEQSTATPTATPSGNETSSGNQTQAS